MFNDLTAPRFSSKKYKQNIVSEDLYKRWKLETKSELTFKQFKDIWNKIADQLITSTTEERDGIRLPSLGDIYIGYIPQMQKKIIDYKLSKEYGKPILHENWDSGSKFAKIIYGATKRKYLFKLAGWWSFKACRNFKIAVVKALRETPERYKNTIERR